MTSPSSSVQEARKALEPKLGEMLSEMLVSLSDRGPDSAGIAIYGSGGKKKSKITIQSADPKSDFDGLGKALEKAIGAKVDVIVKSTHAVIEVPTDKVEAARDANWILCAIGPSRPNEADLQVHEVEHSSRYDKLHDRLKSQRSQWVYVQRGLTVFDGEHVFILKSARLPEWTRARALLDSDEVISEILANRK